MKKVIEFSFWANDCEKEVEIDKDGSIAMELEEYALNHISKMIKDTYISGELYYVDGANVHYNGSWDYSDSK